MFKKFGQRGWYFSADGGASTGSAAGAGSADGGASGKGAADGGASTGSAAGAGSADSGTSWKTFEEYVKGQPDDVQKLYSEHITGLKNTVAATREERDKLAGQLKEVLPKVEKGSELEKTLLGIQGELDQATKRANFAEDAIKPEIGCRNIKAAFALAMAEDLFDKRGNPNWAAIKETAPELFGVKVPDGDGGSGSRDGGTGKTSMDDLIRAKVR